MSDGDDEHDDALMLLLTIIIFLSPFFYFLYVQVLLFFRVFRSFFLSCLTESTALCNQSWPADILLLKQK